MSLNGYGTLSDGGVGAGGGGRGGGDGRATLAAALLDHLRRSG